MFWRKAMNKKSSLGKGIILTIYIALKPLYLRASGSMQISDCFLMLALVYLIGTYKGVIVFPKGTGSVSKLLIGMLIYQLLINGVWSIILGQNLMKPCLYYMFNFLAFVICLMIGDEIGQNKLKKAMLKGCLFASIVTGVGLVIGNVSGRATAFFNNPNQLGYIGLIIISILVLCVEEASRYEYGVILFLSIWMIIASASKAAFIAAVVLYILFIIFRNKNSNPNSMIKKIIALVLVGSILYIFFFSESQFIISNKNIIFMRNRLFNMANENDSDLGSGRGYDRIAEMGLHFLWGMGEGAYNRFDTMRGVEVHSTFASLMVSYGLIGFIGYMMFFKLCMGRRNLFWKNAILLSGVFLYSISHNGIRNTLLWIIMAVMLLESIEKGTCD
jgi:hypothetical protein